MVFRRCPLSTRPPSKANSKSYGEQSVFQRVIQETTDIDGPDNPIAVFVFKYRSKDDLKSELIIPRSPSPEPARRPSQAPNGNNRDDRAAKEARMRELKVRLQAVPL